jgi:hypothetical protein
VDVGDAPQVPELLRVDHLKDEVKSVPVRVGTTPLQHSAPHRERLAPGDERGREELKR